MRILPSTRTEVIVSSRNTNRNENNSIDITIVENAAVEAMTIEASPPIRIVIDDRGENCFILTGVLDAYLAEELHRCARKLLESGRGITVDLSEVDSMDVCSMQILLALRRDLGSLGKDLVVSAASEKAARSFRTAGIAGVFALA